MIKRKTVEKLILSILIMIVCMIGVTVQADSGHTFKAAVTPTEKTLKPGEEITITMNISDINMGDNGINTVEGNISYDNNIFEEVKSSNIQALNNWSTTYNDEGTSLNGKFLSVNLSAGVKENTSIFSIKLKVKSSLNENKETYIQFNNITSNDGTNLVNAGNKSVKVTVQAGTQENKNVDTTGGQTTSDTKNNTTSGKTDKTQSKTILPKTGISSTVLIILATLLIVTIVLAIKNRMMKDIK